MFQVTICTLTGRKVIAVAAGTKANTVVSENVPQSYGLTFTIAGKAYTMEQLANYEITADTLITAVPLQKAGNR